MLPFQFDPSNSFAWIKYAELETQLEDLSRARAIFELGVSQSPLSMPELLWKAYIDFEIEEGERESARALYERLLSLSGHIKVWIAYALFEAEAIPLPRSQREEEEEGSEPKTVDGDVKLARQVFERGYQDLKKRGLKHEVRQRGVSLPPLYMSPYRYNSVLHCWRFGRLSRKIMVRMRTLRKCERRDQSR
jgi:crooked neck